MTTLSKIKNTVSYWWILLLTGIALILLGIYVFMNPLASYAGLSIYFAVALFFNGVFEITFSLSNRKSVNGWVWFLAGGIFDLIIGIFLILNPVVAAASLPLFVGLWLLCRNISIIIRSFDLKQAGLPDWGWLLVSGLGGVVFSVLIISNPIFGAGALVIWTALALFSVGALNIYLGIRLSSAHKWFKNHSY